MTASVSSPTTLGFGIVGIGMIADFHAHAIAGVRGAKLVGAVTRDPAKGRAFAQKHGFTFTTADIDALVARPDVHVVCITTPSGKHLEPALAAIRAGKHVIIEKPIEINTARADEILRAADAAGVHVTPIFQSRFGDGARTIKAMLDSGRLGRLVLASAYVKWHRSLQYYAGWKGTLEFDGGGAVINQAIHGLDLLQWFVGLPAEIFAWKTRRVYTHIEAEDTACATLRFADGALGAFEASTALWPGWARRHELCGEHGSVVLEDDRITKWDFRDARPEDAAIRSAAQQSALGSGASDPGAITPEGHRRQIQDLVDAIHAGRAPLLNGHEGRKAVAFVNAIYDSANRGVPVKL